MNRLWICIAVICWAVVAQARLYRHSKAELARTDMLVETIDQQDCEPDETPIFVHTAAQAAGKYHDRRMSIRRTWGQEAADNKMKLIFVIARPKNPSDQKHLEAESDKYRDMLQFDFIDDYYNLTLKGIGELKWAEKHCNTSRYVVKADDDVILNVPLLSKLVQSEKIPSGFTGMMFHTPAYRQPGYKWYMPRRFYPQDSYQFLLGFTYILSNDKLGPLLDTVANYEGPILDIDDVFLTGVVADAGRIKRHSSGRFRFYCGMDACAMENSIAVTCSNNRNMERMYRGWKEANVERCYASFGPYRAGPYPAIRGF